MLELGTEPSPSFLRRVDAQARVFFEEVLPRYVDRDFRGAGYMFLHQMLVDHDRRDPGAVVRDSPAPPTRRALRRAAGTRALCPCHVDVGDGSKFGEFLFREEYQSRGGVDYRELAAQRHVVVYEKGFEFVAQDRWDEEILLTLLHEYIHCFESFMPASARPLTNRELVAWESWIRDCTTDEARRKDTLFLCRWWGFWAVVALIALALLWAVLGEELARLL